MRIADISIRQPVFITMIILMTVVLGILAFTQIGVDLMPDVTLPIVAVTVVNPGVGPEEMESQVTKPIEDIVSTINGIKKISSTSSEGVTVLIAEFVLEKDAQQAATDVREKVAFIRNTLPREIQEPVIDKFDPTAAPILSYNITGADKTMDLPAVRDLVDDRIKPLIQQVEGVGAVTLLGGREREIHVEVDPRKLNELGLSVAQVSQAIRGENINLPAGRVTRGTYDFLLRTKAEFVQVAELENVVIAHQGGRSIPLREVATVSDDFKTKRSISRFNGVPCVSLVIRKQSGTNTVRVADLVKKCIQNVQKDFPQIDLRLSTDESLFIKESRDDVLNSLILGALLAGVVVLFSFGDLRNTIITIAGLPVCIIGTFFVMQLCGYSINVLTLLALSLSVGLLIDDAIVVRENIFRHMEKLGKDPRSAASDGTSEVGLAVMATTFTIVAVFLPIAFATGIAGKFLRQFGVTVTAAVLISLFEAFTFAPMLSAYFFKKSFHGVDTSENRFQRWVGRFYDKLANGYRPVLRWAVGHRKTVVLLTSVIFVLSMVLFRIMGTSGSPRGQRPEFNIVVQCTAGTSVDGTAAKVAEIERILHAQPEVTGVLAVIGSDDGASDEATLNVKIEEKMRSRSQKIQDRLRPQLAAIPGITFAFQEASSMGGTAASALMQQPILINLRGADLNDLTRAAEMVRAAAARVQGLVDINTDYRNPKSEIRIATDRERAVRLGVGTFQVASVMRSFVDGDLASRFRAGEKLVDIRVRLAPEFREDLRKLSTIYIPTLRGGTVTLDQVARLESVMGPSQIKRKDRNRQIVVGANILQGTPLNEIKQRVDEAIRGLRLPPGITYDFGGQVEQNAESFASLFLSLILGVLFVYMILASQFGSFLQPFAIMLALPLSIIGAVLGLLAAGKLFDMMAFIGLIMLMGLVTKNSILLIDYTNVLRRSGMERAAAIVEAGATRLRPILMTSLAMILGMIPVAFGFGTSSDFRAPIGFTIIGGLISSTILTLVIVPVAYTFIDDIPRIFRRKKK